MTKPANRPYQTYHDLSDAMQVAPGVFVSADEAETFLDQLDNDPDTLAAFIDLVESVRGQFTPENVDAAIWAVYAPILHHINFQRRVAFGDTAAVQIARACALWRAQQSHPITYVRVNPFSEWER